MERVNTEGVTCLKSHPYMCLACLQHYTVTQTVCNTIPSPRPFATLYRHPDRLQHYTVTQTVFSNHPFIAVLYTVLTAFYVYS
jgi:hypothetical protein